MKTVVQIVVIFAALHWQEVLGSENTNPPTVFSTPRLLETWGWQIAHERNVAGIEVSDAELRAFLRGMSVSLKNQPSPYDLQKISPDVEILSVQRRKNIAWAQKRENLIESDGFFAALKLNPNVVPLPSGSGYEILQPGDGPFPEPQQTVHVHYTGRMIDGTEFIEVGPADVILATNHLNIGLFEGMQKISPNGRLRLYIPPAIAEPDAERMGVPLGATMVFEIEMLGATNTSPEDLAAALIPSAPELPPATWSAQFSERQVIENWGWSIGQQLRLAQLQFNKTEIAAFLAGMSAGIKNEPPPPDLEKIQPQLEKFVADRRGQARQALKQKQLADGAALFTRLRKNPKVVQLPDGLRYEILHPGQGDFPKPGQWVTVNYTGRLLDGKVFDSSDPTLGPLDIDLDTVIHGWSEGVQKINRGGKIKLYVPPSLGYGDKSVSGIPPDAVLIFEIELLDIKDRPSNEAATASPQ